MKFALAGKYAAFSDDGKYTITWGDHAPPYHAAIRAGFRFGGSLGSHPDKEAAKAACAKHAKETV